MTQGGTSFIQLHTSLTVTLTLIVVLGFSASQNLVVAYTIETDSIPTKVPASKTVTICEAFAADFAQAAADYTKCFLLNARPLTLCTKCITEFLKVNKTYGELEQVSKLTRAIDSDVGLYCLMQHQYNVMREGWVAADWVFPATNRLRAGTSTNGHRTSFWKWSCGVAYSSV